MKHASCKAIHAIAQIDQLLHHYDHGGQILSALPLLREHRKTLLELQRTLGPYDHIPRTQHGDRETNGLWVEDLVRVYQELGGYAPHTTLYKRMGELRRAAGRSWPSKHEETIRQTLQAHNVQAKQYRGGADLFRMIRRGMWGLKTFTSRRSSELE